MFWVLRSGSFLTRQRAAAYSVLLIAAYVVTFAALFVTKSGVNDAFGRPLGTDFANVYAAGQMALEGRAAQAYDWQAHHAVQKAIANRADTPYFGWHYPPLFLLAAVALAHLSYLGALLAFQAVTLGAYLAVIHRVVERPDVWLPAAAFPAVFVNLGHGHNGFLTAALIGGALLVLDRRPVLAGVLIGCLAYKPQFGLLIPLVLVATGRWRTIAAASATVTALCALTLAAFGTGPWVAFYHSLSLTQHVILEEGATGFHKIQSVFAALRLVGAPVSLAYAAQGLTALGLGAALVALWRSPAAIELKAAALTVASLLATPYALDYDLVVLAPAIAFLARHGIREGFAPYEITCLVILWIVPLVARPVAWGTLVSLGPLAMIATFVLILHRAHLLDGAGTALALVAERRRSGHA
jgi:Glycosyltransferase family 87